MDTFKKLSNSLNFDVENQKVEIHQGIDVLCTTCFQIVTKYFANLFLKFQHLGILIKFHCQLFAMYYNIFLTFFSLMQKFHKVF